MQFKNVLHLVLISSAIGLVFNHFNPKGISLIQKDKERLWTNSLQDSPDNISSKDSILNDKHYDITGTESNELDHSLTKNEDKNQNIVKNSIKDFEKPLAITLENAYRLFNQGMVFVDARNREDYLRNHIKNSINIPFYQFEEFSSELQKIKKEIPFVIYCNGKDCDMSDMLADVLFEMGYRKIYLFVGGWEEWEAARYPSAIPYNQN